MAEIDRQREIMEHSIIALTGIDYLLAEGIEDTSVKDEFALLDNCAEDALINISMALAQTIARSAVRVYRLAHGLPEPHLAQEAPVDLTELLGWNDRLDPS